MKRLKQIWLIFAGKDGKLSWSEAVKVVSFSTAIFMVIASVVRGGTIDTATLVILLTAAGLYKTMK